MINLKDQKEDFTQVNYQRLLKMALRKYKIGSVADCQRLDENVGLVLTHQSEME